jgi:hypothetical protein
MPRIQVTLTREAITVRVELSAVNDSSPQVIETSGELLSERPGLAKTRSRALTSARKVAL